MDKEQIQKALQRAREAKERAEKCYRLTGERPRGLAELAPDLASDIEALAKELQEVSRDRDLARAEVIHDEQVWREARPVESAIEVARRLVKDPASSYEKQDLFDAIRKVLGERDAAQAAAIVAAVRERDAARSDLQEAREEIERLKRLLPETGVDPYASPGTIGGHSGPFGCGNRSCRVCFG